MRIGIAVFAYNRSKHLEYVLDGLQKNNNINQLYIFQDGLKCEEHREEWDKTRKLIENINWCKVIKTLHSENQGLAKSIIFGIEEVLKENDAIIVLEDDCIPHLNFICFMKQCLEKYYDNKRVYTISGYSWPVDTPQDEYDIYFSGRISSWGWATWKDRWQEYEQDYTLLKKIKEDLKASKRLAYWGYDLEEMLKGNLTGQNNSWAVFWALKIIEKDGVCINPYMPLIKNIGMDGSGVHSGIADGYDIELSDEKKMFFQLPEEIIYNEHVKNNFIYKNPLVGHFDKKKSKVIIYGIGKSFEDNKENIGRQFQVVALADRQRNGCVDGFLIIKPEQIKDYKFEFIVIMNQSFEISQTIARELIEKYCEINKKIQYGCILYKNLGIQEHSIKSDGTCDIRIGELTINISSENELREVEEVLNKDIYHFNINNGKENNIVIIGNMNKILYAEFNRRSDINYVYQLEEPEELKIKQLIAYNKNKNIILFFEYINQIDISKLFQLRKYISLYIIKSKNEEIKALIEKYKFNYIVNGKLNLYAVYYAWSK